MGTTSQHQLSSFASPVNGTSPIDANTVRGNDNSIRSSYNAHDADTTIHVQNGAVATRPAASTAGQMWLANDSSAVYLYLDTGSAWVEVNYLRNTGGTVSGAVTISGTIAATSHIRSTGAYSTDVASSILIDYNTGRGRILVEGPDTSTNGTFALVVARSNGASGVDAIVATASTVTIGTATTVVQALTVSGSVSMVGVAGQAAILGGSTGFKITNNAVSADNFSMTDAGAVTIRAGLTVSAGTTAVQALTATTIGGTVVTASVQVIAPDISSSSGGTDVTIHNGGTLVATFSGTNARSDFVGGLNATGNFAIATSKFTVAASTGNTVVAGTLSMTTASSKIIPGSTGLSIRNNADSADNLLISDIGVVTARSSVTAPVLTVSAGAGGTTTTSLTKINTASVSTATAITNAVGVGLSIVNGNDGSNFFKDIVSWGTAGATATSSTVSGAPAVRTYSVVAGQLKVAMASGTYAVETATFS